MPGKRIPTTQNKIIETVRDYLEAHGMHEDVDDFLIRDYARVSVMKEKVWRIANKSEVIWESEKNGYQQIGGALSTWLKLVEKHAALGDKLALGPMIREKIEDIARTGKPTGGRQWKLKSA